MQSLENHTVVICKMYRVFEATEVLRGLSDLHQNCTLSEILEGRNLFTAEPHSCLNKAENVTEYSPGPL